MASAKAQRLAAIDNARLLRENQASTTGQLEDVFGRGVGAVRGGVAQGRQDIASYTPMAIDALTDGRDAALASQGQQYGTARGVLAPGVEAFSPWTTAGGGASAMYANSLGLNGPGGHAAATGAFQAGPGYGWQVDQATDAAARKANALGIGASGNTLDAITRLASNLANQEYGGWQDRLSGLSGQGLSAAGQQQGARQSLAALDTGYGDRLAGLYGDTGRGLAGLYSGAGTALAGLESGAGGQVGSLYGNLGSNISALNRDTVNNVTQGNFAAAAAGDAARNANENMWLGLAGQALGMGLGGGKTVGGSLFSGMGSLFR